MLTRQTLDERFTLYPPATESAIAQEEVEFGQPLPAEYLEFLRISNGALTDGNLNICGVEGIVQRNADYQVQRYMPGYFMIGDDCGGTAILLRLQDRRIYEVEMGIMDEDCIKLNSDSLEDLLTLGTSLCERDGG